VRCATPGRYRSLSAFAPICHADRQPLGREGVCALSRRGSRGWRAWDACELIARADERLPLLVDQGEADGFLADAAAARAAAAGLRRRRPSAALRLQPGYDHSYYFIASFIDDHLRHHAALLLSASKVVSGGDHDPVRVGQGVLEQPLVGDGELIGRAHDAAALALDFLPQEQHAGRGIEADAQRLDVDRLDQHIVGTGIDRFDNIGFVSRRSQQQGVALLAGGVWRRMRQKTPASARGSTCRQ
jgi:hypothetical protein